LGEADDAALQGALLDLTSPADSLGDGACDLIDAIADPLSVLPWPNQYPQAKNISAIMDELVARVSSGLDSILNYPTDMELSRMKLAGALAGTAMLRYAEFCRRVAATASPKLQCYSKIVDNLLDCIEVVFAKEMWRRWALGSFGASPKRDAEVLLVMFSIWMEAVVRSNITADEVRTPSKSGKIRTY